MQGRLNLFQRTMLHWSEIHPYIAVHAVRMSEPFEPARLRHVIAAELEALGLTGLELKAQRGTFEYRGGPADVLLEASEADPTGAWLQAEFEAQLNRAFPHGGRTVSPFRFFARGTHRGFWLGVAYDHFIAGGDSVAVLMKRVVRRYQGDTVVARLDLYPSTFRRLFLACAPSTAAALASLPQLVRQCRRSARSPLSGSTDCHNSYASFPLDPGEFGALRAMAASHGVTLNDLLLTLALRALAPLAAGRDRAKRRRELTVASIMNIRREFQPPAERVFGQFLSSFRVSHAVPEGVTLAELSREVHRQTRLIKSHRLYLQTLLALAACQPIWRMLSVERRRGMYAKSCPVWAGISVLDVNALWPREGDLSHPLEYVRAASTGPLAPLVFAVTVFADSAHLGVIFRPDVFSQDVVNGIVHRMLEGIRVPAPACPQPA
jgi:hypothetical protein